MPSFYRPLVVPISGHHGIGVGDLLQGVRFFGGGARTHSLVMAYQTKQVRFVDTVHMFDRESPPRVRL
jgi:fructose-1,6-bisphosphatase II